MDKNASTLEVEIPDIYSTNYENEELELDDGNPNTVIILEEVDDETDVECDDLFEETACSYSVDPVDLDGADSEEADLVLCDPDIPIEIEDKIRKKDESHPILTISKVPRLENDNVPNPENATNFVDINSLKQKPDSDDDLECVLISDDEDIPLKIPTPGEKICKLKNIPEATEETILNEFSFEDKDVCIVDEESPKKILVHMTSKGYRCPLYCTFTVKEQSSMISHLIMHKKSVVMNTNESEAAYQCPMCPFITSFHSAFVNHICYHKKTNVGLICSHCTFRTMSLATLKQHIAVNHAAYLFCLNCTFKTRNKKVLKRHQDRCRRPKKFGKTYSCHFDPCPFTAPTEEGLKTHEWIQHQVAASKICSYKCPLEVCHFETFRKELFDEHMSMHSLEELQCQLCNFKTPNFIRFKEHILLHISVP